MTSLISFDGAETRSRRSCSSIYSVPYYEPGPIPRTVLLPGSIWVRPEKTNISSVTRIILFISVLVPASRIKHVVKPFRFACKRNCSLKYTHSDRDTLRRFQHFTYRSSADSHLHTTFAWPWENQVSTASGYFSQAFWKHPSVACEHWREWSVDGDESFCLSTHLCCDFA